MIERAKKKPLEAAVRLLNQFGFPTPDQRCFRADTGRVLDLEARVKKSPAG